MMDETPLEEASVEDLLQAFDEAQPPVAEPAEETDLAEKVEKLEAEIFNRSEAEAGEQEKADFHTAVGMVAEKLSGSLDRPLPEKFVESFLLQEYLTDPLFRNAWDNRDQHPDLLLTNLNKAAKQIASDPARRVDAQMTEDKAALTMAVRGAASTPPPAQELTHADLNQMSDQDFQKLKMKHSK